MATLNLISFSFEFISEFEQQKKSQNFKPLKEDQTVLPFRYICNSDLQLSNRQCLCIAHGSIYSYSICGQQLCR